MRSRNSRRLALSDTRAPANSGAGGFEKLGPNFKYFKNILNISGNFGLSLQTDFNLNHMQTVVACKRYGVYTY